jgi:hypothetical protein
MLLTKKFWLHTGERALKTAAQTAAGLMSANGLGLLDVDWKALASVAGLSFVYSVLTSVASAGGGDSETPSLVK